MKRLPLGRLVAPLDHERLRWQTVTEALVGEAPCDRGLLTEKMDQMNATDVPKSDGARDPAHDELTLSEALVTAILGAAFNAIVSIDERGLIQTINPATEELFGYRQDELIGQNVKL